MLYRIVKSKNIPKKADDEAAGVPVSRTQVRCQGNAYEKAKLLAIESFTTERLVEDVKNEIKIVTATPNGELLLAGDLNYASLYNPDSEGFYRL
jgi:hypothetical protein